MYPTGDTVANATVTLTVSVAFSNDGIANDWLLQAVRNQLIQLTSPSIWDDDGYTVTAQQAADAALAMYNSLTLT